MGAMASQITSLTISSSTIYLDTDQRKHQSSASLAFVRGISPHKWPVTRKMFTFDDVIMSTSEQSAAFSTLTVQQIALVVFDDHKGYKAGEADDDIVPIGFVW